MERERDNRMIELVNGFVEFLPTPDPYHQRIMRYLYDEIAPFVKELKFAEVLLAPLPVRLWQL